MTTLPLLILIGSLLLAVAFECGYAFVDKRWSTPLDKAPWGLIYWIAVGIVVTNEISSGENAVSCDNFKLTFPKCQSPFV